MILFVDSTMTKDCESNNVADGGGGMSRAAKKRAKKKQKSRTKHMEERPPPATEKKRPLPLADDEDNASVASDPKKRAKPPHESPEDKQRKNPVERMIYGAVSKLAPAKILQVVALDADEKQAMIGTEQISVSDLLKELTTRQRAHAVFQSILGPAMTLQEFYDSYWEKQPLYIPAGNNNPRRLDGFLSKNAIQNLLDMHPMYYGRDLNVTRYEESSDGVKRRITLDPQPTNEDDDDFVLADGKDCWANYETGCTIRLLCPHKHNDAVHALLSTLEWEWGCMVGANAYLTPPAASQGFAPHYDDIEAFCLQLEGYKHWKVYAPLSKAETLPRTSSADYTEEDLKGVEPELDVALGPGDLLYIPRGWIHQACTTSGKGHSLHLTVSAMQQWAWADYLEILMPEALGAAAASDTSTSLREGLPLRFLDYMGVIHDTANEDELPDGLKQTVVNSIDKEDAPENEEDLERSQRLQAIQSLREEFREEATKRIMRVSKEALSLLDAECDQIGKRFLSERLPPAFTPDEAASTAVGEKIWPDTLVRLTRPGIARLALEDGKAVLYHCVDNSRVYQENRLSPLEFEMDDAPALEMLLTTVEPHWIQVQDLIHDDIEDKLEISKSLYEEGILSVLQTDKVR